MTNFTSSSVAITTILFFIFSAAAVCTAAPIHRRSSMNDTNGPHDIRWRLNVGMEVAEKYIIKLNSISNQNTKFMSPLNITSEELPIGSLCDLLIYYELLNKVDISSDISVILRQNINDSCRWIKYLVENDCNVTWSSGYSPELSLGSEAEQTSDCNPEDLTLLHRQCLAMRLASMSSSIRAVRTYTSNGVVNPSVSAWINSTASINEEQGISILKFIDM